MSHKDIWLEKVAEQFHDPFFKSFCQGSIAKEISRRIGATLEFVEADDFFDKPIDCDEVLDKFAQDTIVAQLSKHLLGDRFTFPDKYRNRKQGYDLEKILDTQLYMNPLYADITSAGADRPVLGTSHQNRVQFWKPDSPSNDLIVTHPLDSAPLKLPSSPIDVGQLWEIYLKPSIDLLTSQAKRLRPENKYRDAFYYLWRQFPDELTRKNPCFWPLQPSDTRCPDHSIWDHLRMSSALYFIPKTKTADDRVRAGNSDKRPWLMSLWVGPPKDFIHHSRTGRDLWTGSLMLSEMAWSMLEPIIEEIGADNIVYPDLRGNHRCDIWLRKNQILESENLQTGTLSSLIPNRVVVLVPEARVEEFGKNCMDAVQTRWQEMVTNVRSYLRHSNHLGAGPWLEIFNRQTEHAPTCNWTATAWKWDGYNSGYKTKDMKFPPSVPFLKDPDQLPKPIQDIEDKRVKRFEEWIDYDTWKHYKKARYTFLQTHPGYLLNQRGFDYSLTHHKLLGLHSARKNIGSVVTSNELPGDKCTLCGERQALTNNTEGPVGRQRDEATRFWRKMDPEHVGHERLCGICAVRRYLSESNDSIEDNWSGLDSVNPGHKGPEIPFPSTGLIAAQDWIDEIIDSYSEPELQKAIHRIVTTFRRTGFKETQFVRSLARFRTQKVDKLDSTLRSFLRIEIQYLDPEFWTPLKTDSQATKDLYQEMKRHCSKLYSILEEPPTHIAVVKIDGDQLGKLILGSPDRIGVNWRDVLHPDAVQNIVKAKKSEKEMPAWKASWQTLLDEKRLMGPSIHAFISRVLREFSNRVLPWVVELQYSGRLIYSGGDDALILCRAEDAISMIRTLSEIYSSPWIVDQQTEKSAWQGQDKEKSSQSARFITKIEDLNTEKDIIIPMLGQHSTFSAGVAFGHFKTSLRLLLNAAETGLNNAKNAGRNRTSLSWFTRNGVKRQWIGLTRGSDNRSNLEEIEKLTKLFESKIPRGLPYKLVNIEHLAESIINNDITDSEQLLARLVENAMDFGAEYSNMIVKFWKNELTSGGTNLHSRDSVAGLLFARDLSTILKSNPKKEGK